MRNKPRLCLALYIRPKHPGTYDYALLVCPKDLGLLADKYYVENVSQVSAMQSWEYECSRAEDLTQDPLLLARCIVAKVLKPERINEVLQRVPLCPTQQSANQDANEMATRVSWIHLALAKLRDAGVISRLEPWASIRGRAVRYVEQKKMAGRWDGEGKVASPSVPTLDLLPGPQPNSEVIP